MLSNKGSSSSFETKIIIGAQWGDEGKGKIVDLLAEDADLVCRGQGGSNAGHTVVVGETSYFFHLIPRYFKRETLLFGLHDMEKRIEISNRAHIVFDMHQTVDGLLEGLRGKKSIGTTKRGIGPTYGTKALRNGIRVCDLMGNFEIFKERFKALVSYHKAVFPELEVDVDKELETYKNFATRLRPMVKDTVLTLYDALQSGKRILIEGANATMLDLDFGTYPFVTSSTCSVGGPLTGLGIPATKIQEVIGVVKAYTTRVGSGTLPTELTDEIGEKLQKTGHEFGTTTGRPRRCGWLDLVVVKYANMVNGFTSIALTKLDVLDDISEIKIGVNYLYKGERLPAFPANMETLAEVEVEYITLPGWKTNIRDIRKYSDLPANAKSYIEKIQEILQIPIKWVGVGQSRAAIVPVM
eukprot:gene3104-1397_t